MAQIARFAYLLLPGAALAWLAGCADTQPTGTPVRLDPTKTRREAVDTADIAQVSAEMMTSMRRNKQLEARPSKIIVIEKPIAIDPALHAVNGEMIYNQFVADLNQVAAGEYRFLDRAAVAAERERQLTGQVKTSGIEKATAGADLVLKINLIAQQGGGTTTVQYNFSLVDVSAGEILWQGTTTSVKQR